MGNSWRTDDDINDHWDALLRSLDNTVGLSRFAGPGKWNDPDMLEVGNGGMTNFEYRAHFALWALLKSPMLIGCDIRNMTADTKKILLNKEIIAISQDSLGAAGDLVWKQGPNEVYATPLSDGSRAVVAFNRHTQGSQYKVHNITVNFQDIGFPKYTKARVRDLWEGKDLGVFEDEFVAAVYLHDGATFKVSPVIYDESYLEWRPHHNAERRDRDVTAME